MMLQLVVQLCMFYNDAFFSHKDKPYRFQLGTGEVIEGFDEGLVDMCPGEKRRLTVPPHLAYGHEGGRMMSNFVFMYMIICNSM